MKIGIMLLPLLVSSVASATVILTPGVDNTGTENVLYTGAGTVDLGNPVIGRTNQTDTLVQFDSTGTLEVQGGGQARIEGESGGTWDDISFMLADPGLLFAKAVFALNLAGGAGTGDISVGWVNPTLGTQGTEVFSDAAIGNGVTFFTLSTADGQLMTNVAIGGNTFSDIRQVRIGGIQSAGGDVVIPEPGTMSLMGGGLLLAVAALRKKARNQ